ncbi:MAG: JAB domain-containing protein [Erythrobacter sp.]
MQVALRERVTRTRIGDDPVGFHNYLLSKMRGLRTERLIAFFCDGNGYLISEERLADGMESAISVSTRRLFTRALALDAKSVLLAHNHPSGSAEPSEQDIKNTRLFGLLAREVDIALDDHFVVGRHEVVSMKGRGLL